MSPQDVRKILGVDNQEIVDLCKRASIRPKKNSQGQTYFSYDEVRNLKKAHQDSKGHTSLPIVHGSDRMPQPASVRNILTSIKDMEKNISEQISKVIDEKLEGMDEVVVELIRCKTDNETLRQKIIDLNKEIYQLKNTLSCYKPVALGLYRKIDKHTWE
ncbi:MAG: hypothetical protein NC390_01055 [Fusobacterium sp.]|nr:hypothetical protein [Fusobacterium sp.]